MRSLIMAALGFSERYSHAAAEPLMQVNLLLVAGGVELLEIGPQIGALLLVLDAGEHHLGAGNLGARIGDVFLEGVLAPGDAGVPVGLAVIVALDRAGLAPLQPV